MIVTTTLRVVTMPPLYSSTMVIIATLTSRYSNVVAAKSPKAKHSSRARTTHYALASGGNVSSIVTGNHKHTRLRQGILQCGVYLPV